MRPATSLAERLNMSSKKGFAETPQQPAQYRDDPQYAETSSMASAVLLDDVDIFPPDEELPSYEDTTKLIPGLPTPADDGPSRASPANRTGLPENYSTYFEPPPIPPFSTHDLYFTEYRTHFPNYSTNAKQLYDLIREQASYRPTYYVQLHGTHEETRRSGNKDTKEKITDFYIKINLTNLLRQQDLGSLELLPGNKRGYRGTIIPRLHPTVAPVLDIENPSVSEFKQEELRLWCEKYVNDPAKVKSFTLTRKVFNHDQKRLNQLLRAAISETQYRGHLDISYPMQNKTVIIYSPSLINKWRMTVWVRWVFYLTFLWIFAWPVLFFLTSRYKVVDAVFVYANEPPGNDVTRKCWVMNEVEWFRLWERAIKHAAMGRMVSKDDSLNDDYRVTVDLNEARREQGRVTPRREPSTGNSFADGALGFIREGLGVVAEYQSQRPWGMDS